MIRAAVAGVGLTVSCLAIARLPNLVDSALWFLVLFCAAWGCYAVAVWSIRAVDGLRPSAMVLVIGLGARAILLPALPTLSTDAYRYVWDARVAFAGTSPYAHAPADPELAGLRDAEIFPRLNHTTWRTIYPPAAQLFFQVVYHVSADSVLAMKAAIGLVELVGLATVFGLLRAAGQSPVRGVIYAWNPLVLVEVWGTGHVDGILIPFVAGAMWALIQGRHGLAGALLGVGALIKLYPVALLAMVPVRAWPVGLASFVLVMLAGYLPALASGSGVLGSLPRYLSEEYFNPGLVRALIDVPAVTLAAAVLWIVAMGPWRGAAPSGARAVMLAGGLVLLSPNIFPWYAVWLVPLLALAPSLPWLTFTGTVAFAYAFFLREPWSVPGWARVVEFAPLAAGAMWWLGTRLPLSRWRERWT
jgi:Glycosyltransferase family 87